MTSPIAQTNPENAPRDLAALVRLGRYHLRLLSNQLNMFQSEQEKQAFMSEPTEKQAEHVLTALQRLDAASGGPQAVPPPAQAAAPPPQQANGAPQEQQQAPRGLRRTPRTQQQTTAQDAGVTGPIPTANVGHAAPTVVDLQPVNSALAVLQKDMSKLAKADDVLAKLEEIKKLVALQTALTLLLAEQSLGAGREDILLTATEDAAAVLDYVNQLGKAKK